MSNDDDSHSIQRTQDVPDVRSFGDGRTNAGEVRETSTDRAGEKDEREGGGGWQDTHDASPYYSGTGAHQRSRGVPAVLLRRNARDPVRVNAKRRQPIRDEWARCAHAAVTLGHAPEW